MDEDLGSLTRDRLVAEIVRLRAAIREHRDSSLHELCWHHPKLWGLLPERTDPQPVVPDWPQFLRGCIRYRQSLDEQLPTAPRAALEFGGGAAARLSRPDARLGAIAGRWATSGSVLGEPPVSVRGMDVYEVLDGGHFLVHHVDVTVGGNVVRAVEVLGERDPDGDGFLARSFDNSGNTEVMRLTIDDDGVFHFLGGSEVAPAAQRGGPASKTRATLTVAPDRSSMTALWERSDDGSRWKRWMDISFTRVS